MVLSLLLLSVQASFFWGRCCLRFLTVLLICVKLNNLNKKGKRKKLCNSIFKIFMFQTSIKNMSLCDDQYFIEINLKIHAMLTEWVRKKT